MIMYLGVLGVKKLESMLATDSSIIELYLEFLPEGMLWDLISRTRLLEELRDKYGLDTNYDPV